jgi:ribonuclease P protein component
MGPHAMPRQRRIRKRRDFLATQGAGSRIALASCILLLRARGDDGPARVGVTVTRKFGGAVARNRAKRVVREAFRRTPELVPKGIDLVVIPKSDRTLTTAQLIEEWRRAGRLIGARADSLQRELAKTPNTTQTARPRDSTGPGPHRTT